MTMTIYHPKIKPKLPIEKGLFHEVKNKNGDANRDLAFKGLNTLQSPPKNNIIFSIIISWSNNSSDTIFFLRAGIFFAINFTKTKSSLLAFHNSVRIIPIQSTSSSSLVSTLSNSASRRKRELR